MSRTTIVLAVSVLALALTPALALGGATKNSQTFTDSTGEDPAGVDITTTTVSNDDTGLITFQVAMPNRPALTTDMVLLLFVDSVAGAGDAQNFGADYALQMEPAGTALFKWNGSDYLFADQQSSVSGAYANGTAALQVDASELGSPKALNFVVLAISGITYDASGTPDATNAHADVAPDPGRGTYAYQVLTTFSLKSVGFTTSPKQAQAGKAFSVGLAATQSDTGGFVQKGQIACSARIGGVLVPVKARRLVNGVAACSWSLPRTARGKTVRGTISLTVQGVQVKRSFSARIS